MIKYLILLLFLAIEPFSASAYLDPGTGSFIIQIIIAALVGISFTLKIYWKRMVGWLSNIFKAKNKKNV